jgi:nitrate/TMAO reductase-like tetraheme cytochrome c subunit
MDNVDHLGTVFMKYIPPLKIVLMLFFVACYNASQAGAEQKKVVCLDCHESATMKPEFRSIPAEWRKSLHYQNDVSCNDCHGGDPNDAAMAMSRERGFVGKPGYSDVPEFCGKCHIGILKNYLESGHGKALKANQSGPNCVTCHGSHAIVKANIDIINEERCSQCHTYERARTIKQALSLTEKKISDVEKGLAELKLAGVFTEDEEKILFNTKAEFHFLFHSVDVSLIKDRTDGFIKKLNQIESQINELSRELLFRRNFAVFLMLVFLAIGIIVYVISKEIA